MKLTEQILGILNADSRTSVDKIAVMLGVTASEVSSEIRRLEDNGTIVKYGIVINEDKLDVETVEALIEVRVAPQFRRGFDAIAEEIYKFDEVSSLYLMSGGYDLCIIIRGKTLKAVASFVTERLSAMDNVLSTATHFILKKYKCDGAAMQSKNDCKRLAIHP